MQKRRLWTVLLTVLTICTSSVLLWFVFNRYITKSTYIPSTAHIFLTSKSLSETHADSSTQKHSLAKLSKLSSNSTVEIPGKLIAANIWSLNTEDFKKFELAQMRIAANDGYGISPNGYLALARQGDFIALIRVAHTLQEDELKTLVFRAAKIGNPAAYLLVTDLILAKKGDKSEALAYLYAALENGSMLAQTMSDDYAKRIAPTELEKTHAVKILRELLSRANPQLNEPPIRLGDSEILQSNSWY